MWKQACGDPQNGIGPTGNGLMVQDCETGDDAPPRDDLLEILSRAYPQSAPGVLTSLDGGRRARSSSPARSSERSCGLEVWVPGDAEPELQPSRASRMSTTTAVPGGWSVTGCAEGDYTLSTS